MQTEFKQPVTKSVSGSRLQALARKSIAPLVSLAFILPAIPADAAEKDAKRSVSIYCLAYAPDLKSVFVKSGPDNHQSIGLSTANVIEAKETLVEDGRILLYGPAGDDGKHPVVASADIAGVKQPLIVVYPSAEGGKMAYESSAVDADSAEFPSGGFKLVNLSPHSVRISHGEELIEIEAAAQRLFKPDVPAGDALAVRMDYKNGENWALLSSARWAMRDDRRTLVCFQLDPSSKRMIVKSVPLRENPSR